MENSRGILIVKSTRKANKKSPGIITSIIVTIKSMDSINQRGGDGQEGWHWRETIIYAKDALNKVSFKQLSSFITL
ncbi:hypothetical protein [Sutcliffiella horikoshii]|uniref:hypothetical protein n=1 Tax=Sutcliffiella horikoshii TaxID=79883 RepID=UPI0032E801E9